MIRLRITFIDHKINKTPVERIRDILRDFYWNGSTPSDWENFDEQIRIEFHPDRKDGDCVTLDCEEQVGNWIITHIKAYQYQLNIQEIEEGAIDPYISFTALMNNVQPQCTRIKKGYAQ